MSSPDKTQLLIASGNPKKLKELKELLADVPIELVSLNDFPKIKEAEEDGKTFRENAEKKALGYAKQTSYLTLADDSGLVVDYLNGEPGVHSARFAGPVKSDLQNCQRLLQLLKAVPSEKRSASFKCAVALATPSQVIAVAEESVSGRIAEEMQGSDGFGYDPLFFYPEFGKTFGQVSSELKHSVSHRGKALRKMKKILQEYLKKRAVSSSG